MDEQNNQPELEMVPLTDGELELAVPEMEAAALLSLLKGAGIEAEVVGASLLPNLPYQIHVPAGRLEESVNLVKEARAAGDALLAEEGGTAE